MEEKPKLRFEFEAFVTTGRDYPPLIKQAIKEVGPNPRLCPAMFDMVGAAKQNLAGQLHILAARIDNDSDALMGFVMNLTGYPTKYNSTLHAQIDLVYLHPAWRQGWNAVNMFKENEMHLQRLGVKRVLIAEPLRFKNKSGLSLRRLYKYMGFKPFELVFEKYLEL